MSYLISTSFKTHIRYHKHTSIYTSYNKRLCNIYNTPPMITYIYIYIYRLVKFTGQQYILFKKKHADDRTRVKPYTPHNFIYTMYTYMYRSSWNEYEPCPVTEILTRTNNKRGCETYQNVSRDGTWVRSGVTVLVGVLGCSGGQRSTKRWWKRRLQKYLRWTTTETKGCDGVLRGLWWLPEAVQVTETMSGYDERRWYDK